MRGSGKETAEEGCTFPIGGITSPPEPCGAAPETGNSLLCPVHAELERRGEEQASWQMTEGVGAPDTV